MTPSCSLAPPVKLGLQFPECPFVKLGQDILQWTMKTHLLLYFRKQISQVGISTDDCYVDNLEKYFLCNHTEAQHTFPNKPVLGLHNYEEARKKEMDKCNFVHLSFTCWSAFKMLRYSTMQIVFNTTFIS